MKNAIDLTKFAFDKEIREQYRRKLNIENKYVIGNIGRMVFQKNQIFMLHVLEEICRERHDFKLLVVGSGELEENLKRYTQKHGLEDKVLFLGQRNDVNYLLQCMDCFCLPSRFEGLPISMIEAQSAGLPCVVSNQITREADLTGKVEYLDLEVKKWAETIKKLAGIEENRARMVDRVADAGYDIYKQIHVLEGMYQKTPNEKK